MLGAGRWAPLLLWLLQVAPGRPRLAPPRNVTLLSQNFSVYLTWLPGLGNPQNVTYFVAYQGILTPRRWQKVETCAGTGALVCSLMCLKKQDLYNKFKGRVQVASASARSSWVESKYLDYLFEVELAPPVLEFIHMEKILSVNATYQLPPCAPQLDLKYEVEFWKEGTGNRTLFPATALGQLVPIPLHPATRGRHCLRTRTVYTFISSKYSAFSEPTCIFLEAPGASWAVLGLPAPLSLLLAVPVAGVIWKSLKGNSWFQPARMPGALDFSGYRHCVTTFQPSEPESVDDLFLCPQKELTRRVRPAPPVRAPATLLAGSEEDSAEDSEEDTDDSGSFQPYLARPPLLGQELQVAGCSEADESGVDSGGSWTSPVQGEGSSAWDSSGRSWPSTGDSLPWDEARSSGYLAKQGQGQDPGGAGQQEPLPRPESSEDLGSLEEPPKDDLSWWATWDSLSPQQNLVPGEHPVSLQTLTFCWGSGPGEEEEEEEDDKESEPEDSSAGCWGAGSPQRPKVRGRPLGHYMAR